MLKLRALVINAPPETRWGAFVMLPILALHLRVVVAIGYQPVGTPGIKRGGSNCHPHALLPGLRPSYRGLRGSHGPLRMGFCSTHAACCRNWMKSHHSYHEILGLFLHYYIRCASISNYM